MRLDKLPFQLHERYIFQFTGVSQECSETMSGSLKFRRNRQFANELRNRSVDGVPPHAGSFTVPDRTGLRKRFLPIIPNLLNIRRLELFVAEKQSQKQKNQSVEDKVREESRSLRLFPDFVFSCCHAYGTIWIKACSHAIHTHPHPSVKGAPVGNRPETRSRNRNIDECMATISADMLGPVTHLLRNENRTAKASGRTG